MLDTYSNTYTVVKVNTVELEKLAYVRPSEISKRRLVVLMLAQHT
jgi:hypothetical protein